MAGKVAVVIAEGTFTRELVDVPGELTRCVSPRAQLDAVDAVGSASGRDEDMWASLGLRAAPASHEPPDWPDLKRALRAACLGARAIGIPWGGGALVHPGRALEPERHLVVELLNEEDMPREALLSRVSGAAGRSR